MGALMNAVVSPHLTPLIPAPLHRGYRSGCSSPGTMVPRCFTGNLSRFSVELSSSTDFSLSSFVLSAVTFDLLLLFRSGIHIYGTGSVMVCWAVDFVCVCLCMYVSFHDVFSSCAVIVLSSSKYHLHSSPGGKPTNKTMGTRIYGWWPLPFASCLSHTTF